MGVNGYGRSSRANSAPPRYRAARRRAQGAASPAAAADIESSLARLTVMATPIWAGCSRSPPCASVRWRAAGFRVNRHHVAGRIARQAHAIRHAFFRATRRFAQGVYCHAQWWGRSNDARDKVAETAPHGAALGVTADRLLTAYRSFAQCGDRG